MVGRVSVREGFRFLFVLLFTMMSCASARSGGNNADSLVLLKRNISGWEMDGDTVVCSNLAELKKQINDNAPYYIGKGARKVIFQEYKKAGGDACINLEIYQMKERVMAKGLYDDVQVKSSVSLMAVGEEARLADDFLGVYIVDCYKDSIYAKMIISQKTDHSKKALQEFARGMCGYLFP